MTPREKKAARLQREADAWNAAHPVGTPAEWPADLRVQRFPGATP